MKKIENGFKQIVKLQYGFISNIKSLIVDFYNQASVSFDNADWLDFESKLFSCKFSETSKETDGGIVYSQKLSFKLQGDEKNMNNDFYKLVNRELIFRMIYDDGSSKILGEIINPSFLYKDFQSENTDTYHNFYINREDYRPALYLLS